MANSFRSLSDQALNTFASQFYTVLNGAAATYSLSPGDLSAIQAAMTGMSTAVTDQTAKEALFRAAVQTKKTNREILLDIVSMYAKKFYANTAIDNTELAAIGLSPRDTERTPVIPQTPQALVATPRVDGSVKLAWQRNGNPYGVTFVVEARAGGEGDWNSVKLTNRSSVVLQNYTPGAFVEFRVFATKGNLQSTASNVAVIYGEGGTLTLSIAA